MLERALLRVKTLRAMVNELISLTAIQTGNFSLKRAPVDVAEVAAEVIEAAQREGSGARHLAVELSGRRSARCARARRPGSAVHDLLQPRGECHQVLPRRRASGCACERQGCT